MSATAFVAAHARLRLRGTPLLGGGAGLLAALLVLGGLGVIHPDAFASLGEGRAAGLAAFLMDVYGPGAVLLLLLWGTPIALSGLHRRRREGLADSLSAAEPGRRWLSAADACATLLVLLPLALLPVALPAWACRLGVVPAGAVLLQAVTLAGAAGLAATSIHLGAALARTYGGALLVAWAAEGAVLGVLWAL